MHFRGFSLAAGGDRVAFGALVEEKDADLATVAPGSPPRVRLVHPDEDIDPALSPDGTRIAFVRASYQTHDGEGALLLFEPAFRRVRRLAARGADPSWSPDGRRLVFSRRGDLYRLSVTSGRVTRLTRGRPVDIDPAWSPDGRRIAFVRYGQRASLLVLDLATGRTRTLFAGPPDLRDPAWSPRGDAIAFATIESLLTIRAAGGVARTVFRDEDNPISAPAWSPDSRRILFTKGWTLNIPYDWQVPRAHFLAVYVVDAAGRTAPVLFTRGPGWEFGADWRG